MQDEGCRVQDERCRVLSAGRSAQGAGLMRQRVPPAPPGGAKAARAEPPTPSLLPAPASRCPPLPALACPCPLPAPACSCPPMPPPARPCPLPAGGSPPRCPVPSSRLKRGSSSELGLLGDQHLPGLRQHRDPPAERAPTWGHPSARVHPCTGHSPAGNGCRQHSLCPTAVHPTALQQPLAECHRLATGSGATTSPGVVPPCPAHNGAAGCVLTLAFSLFKAPPFLHPPAHTSGVTPEGRICQVIPNETLFQGKVLGEASTAGGKPDPCSSEEQGPVLPEDGWAGEPPRNRGHH